VELCPSGQLNLTFEDSFHLARIGDQTPSSAFRLPKTCNRRFFVEVLDVDISVQAPLFPLFEPKVEPVVGGIAQGVDPGQGAEGS
jgi:hypothetical protein